MSNEMVYNSALKKFFLGHPTTYINNKEYWL